MSIKLLATAVVVLLALVGCGSGDDTAAPDDPAPVEQPERLPEAPDDSLADDAEAVEPDEPNGFVPSEPVPDGLPVYPDAVLWNDLTAGDGSWQWLYQTTGSGNDIVAFFTGALQDLGFDVDEGATFAMYEEFFVTTGDQVVQVYWLATDGGDVDEDTPGRGYGIVVDMDGWASR